MSKRKKEERKSTTKQLIDLAKLAKEYGITYGQLQAMETLGTLQEYIREHDREAIQNDAVQRTGKAKQGTRKVKKKTDKRA